MQDLKFVIAKNIQKLRQEKGMTQLELAEKINYSDKSVSKWERGESLPDIVVLKAVADLFEVTLDYLVEEEHDGKPVTKEMVDKNYRRNCCIITGTSIFIVVLIATLIFGILSIFFPETGYPWLCYAYAVPAALIVWLVFNSLWFNKRHNYLIISLLMWTGLAALFLSVTAGGYLLWKMFLLGIPGQIAIYVWSRYQRKKA